MPPPKPKVRKQTTITKFFTATPTPTVTATPSPPTTSTVTDSFTVTADVHRADVPNEAADESDDIVTAGVALSAENVSPPASFDDTITVIVTDSDIHSPRQATVVSTEPSAATASSSTQSQRTTTLTAKAKQARGRPFPRGWLNDFPWMEYDHAQNCMRCKLCKQCGKRNLWATCGTRNFRIKTVTDHVQSAEHRQSVVASDENQRKVAAGLTAAATKRRNATLLALRACYWLATEEVANVKFKSFLSFLRECGVEDAVLLHRGGNASHDSPIIFNQLLDCLSTVVEEKMMSSIRSSPFVGIGLDESTDRASEKHLAVTIRYVSGGKCCTCYLECVKVCDGKATSIFSALKEVASKYHFTMRKVVGLGTDGANVMASDLNGVNGLISHDNPHVVFVHCVCHRLNLAESQACAGIPDMATLQSLISAVYNFVQRCTTLYS